MPKQTVLLSSLLLLLAGCAHGQPAGPGTAGAEGARPAGKAAPTSRPAIGAAPAKPARPGPPFADHRVKRTPDTIVDYRGQLAAVVSSLPAATLESLPALLQRLAAYEALAEHRRGAWEPGNPALGADAREYRPSDEELLVSELGGRVEKVVAAAKAAQVEQVLARARVRPRFVEYGAITIRHVDVMGSGRFFYASAPVERRIVLRTSSRSAAAARAEADPKKLFLALVSLGVPRRVARIVLTEGKMPAPLCSYRHEPTRTTTAVHAFAHLGGAAKDTYAVAERRDGALVHALTVATPRLGAFTKRLLRSGFTQTRGALPPTAQLVYEKGGVRVVHYKFLPMVDDVASALSRCTGEKKKEILARFSVFVVAR